MRPEPTLLEPIFSPRIWGQRSLAPLFPEKTNLQEPLGEAWLTGQACRVASGRFAGKTLGEAWREMPAEWRGTRLASEREFPLLVKFIFPNDKLSIQVHPDDAYAAVHERAAGGRGKTEMWYAVAAEPGAELLLGMKPGASRESFLAALRNASVEGLFERWSVEGGDTFFVPAGTPHTIGPGMILCEVQEYSDLTYRVYDYERLDASGKPRDLHVEKALAVMNFGEFAGGRVAPVEVWQGTSKKTYLAACRYFAVEKWEFGAGVEAATQAEQFELLIVLGGTGQIECAGQKHNYERAQAWLLPASLGAYRMLPKPETTLLRAYVPDLGEFARRLVAEGVKENELDRIVFA